MFISMLNRFLEGNPVCLPFLIILYHKASKTWSLPRRQRLLVLFFAFCDFIGHFFAVFMWAFFAWLNITARSAFSCKPRCVRLHMKLKPCLCANRLCKEMKTSDPFQPVIFQPPGQEQGHVFDKDVGGFQPEPLERVPDDAADGVFRADQQIIHFVNIPFLGHHFPNQAEFERTYIRRSVD